MVVGWCGCCGALRPRYRRLVDNIYPANPEDGLVKINMDKLMFYAMNSPEKLDRIGEYLAHRLERDVHRRRHGYVRVSMDAVDQLLVTCHVNSLNLFVEFFLKMVRKLLECQEPALQLRATDSFEKFANIREDTPSYHVRYDFFISRFSSLCFSNHSDPSTRSQLRTAGIRGLQGVVRKTNNLGENIWQEDHMDKLVPALLFNIQENPALQSTGGSSERSVDGGTADAGESNTDGGGGADAGGSKSPPALAESCLRELVSRVSSTTTHSIMQPLLVHMDSHKQWNNELMAVHIFKVIMYSIQAQYSIKVVEELMRHLNDRRKHMSRCGIAMVLGQVIPIAAGECVGPSVIETINSLLEQLRLSMSDDATLDLAVGGTGVGGMVCMEEHQQYQDRLVHALAEYTHHLPDYHKIEAMLFILSKVPCTERIEGNDHSRHSSEVRLQHLLLNCLLKIAIRYQSSQYYSSFSTAFLAQLLKFSVNPDAVVRRLILLTLSALLPRSTLPTRPTLCTDGLCLPARGVPPVRQDTNFWHKCGSEILASIEEGCELPNNTSGNYIAVYSVFVQLVAEVRAENVPLDVIRTMLNMQDWCQNWVESEAAMLCQLHALIAAVMAVAAAVLPPLHSHVHAVIAQRQAKAAYLLPTEGEGVAVQVPERMTPVEDDLLFNRQQIIALLQPTNLDEQRVLGSTSVSSVLRRTSSTGHAQLQASLSKHHDTITEEADTPASSPPTPRKRTELQLAVRRSLDTQPLCLQLPSQRLAICNGPETIPFETIKKAASGESNGGPAGELLRQEEETRLQETYALLHEPFEALRARHQPDSLQIKLSELLSRLPPCSAQAALPGTTSALTTACSPSAGLRPLALTVPYPDIITW